jgi:hypothetical protein
MGQARSFLEEHEEVAREGLRAMKEFLLYSGRNPPPDYLQRAKVGAVAVGSYTRLRATMANEKALVLMERRQSRALPTGADK